MPTSSRKRKPAARRSLTVVTPTIALDPDAARGKLEAYFDALFVVASRIVDDVPPYHQPSTTLPAA